MAEPAAAQLAPSVLRGSLRLGLRVVRRFRDNGGLVLANAIAYDGLLSFVPLLLLATALFAQLVDRERFLQVIRAEVLAIVPPRTARPFIDALTGLLEAPSATSVLGLATLLFFSTQAFRTLQRALAVTFRHRHELHQPRTLLASVGIAVAYVLAIGVVSALQALALVGLESVPWLAARVPSSLHFFATIGLAALISSFYLVMQVGRGSTRAALISGALAALTWRGVQVCLVLYLRYVARINVIYGSLSALVVVLLSFEIAAVIVLLGAQLAAELEQSWESGRTFWDEPG
jgi:YihY family inner membrane protein